MPKGGLTHSVNGDEIEKAQFDGGQKNIYLQLVKVNYLLCTEENFWILVDLKSLKRNNLPFEDGWNRKGLIW